MSSKVILQKVILFQILESQIQCLSCFQTPLLLCSYCKAFWEMKASATVSLTGQDSFWKLLQLWASPQPLVLLCLSLAGCVPACSLSSVRRCSQTCSNHIHLLSDTNQVWCLAVSDCGNRFRMWAAGGNQRSSCSAVLTLEVYGGQSYCWNQGPTGGTGSFSRLCGSSTVQKHDVSIDCRLWPEPGRGWDVCRVSGCGRRGAHKGGTQTNMHHGDSPSKLINI